jgi:hypothetical protein
VSSLTHGCLALGDDHELVASSSFLHKNTACWYPKGGEVTPYNGHF